jgi:hypothetical protein
MPFTGRVLVQQDPAVNWSGVAGIVAEDGLHWLDLAALPLPGGGTECRVISDRVRDDIDQPVATATVEVKLSTEAGSLATLAYDSHYNTLSGAYSPAIYARRRIRITEGAQDLFDGWVDLPNATSGGRLTLECRDRAREILDLQLLFERREDDGERYVVTPELPLPALLQWILDEHVNPRTAETWTLVTVGDPEWMVSPYKLEEGSALEKMREAASKRGWSVRLWRNGSGRFELRLFYVDTEATAADYTVPQSAVRDIPRYGVDPKDVRNYLVGEYTLGGLMQPPVIVEDTASQALFGFHPMRIVEGDNSPIDTQPEMHAYLTAALAALKDPALDGSKRIPDTPALRLAEMIAFPAHARIYSSTQTLAVKAWEHSRGAEQKATTVELRGKPAGQHGQYLAAGGTGYGLVAPEPRERDPWLKNFREVARDCANVTFAWELPEVAAGDHATERVDEVAIFHRIWTPPYGRDPWPSVLDVPDLNDPDDPDALASYAYTVLYPSDPQQFTVPVPPTIDQITLLQAEPIQTNGGERRGGIINRATVQRLDPPETV